MIELGKYPTAVAGVFSEEARKGLRKRPDVDYIEEDIEHEIVGQTLPWGIDRVDADVAHGNGETGGDNTDEEGGADIVIIDTGIDDDHPDLQDNLATPLGDTSNHKAWETCKGGNCNYAWSDDHDHGTHVSGIANAIDNSEGVVGVSTAATLHAAKVCSKNGFCSASAMAAALEWAADNGYDVANLSIGGSYSETIDNAGKYAYNNGVLLVSSAGNDGPCTDCVNYPAANEEFIAVSATSSDDSLAGFSSSGCEVELAGPGDDIYSTVIGGYDSFSGTSMSAPHVAGAGAQLMDNGYENANQSSSDAENATCYPTSPGGARGQLQDTAEDLGSLNGNEEGEGLVDVEAALGLAELSVDNLSATEDETSNGDAEFDITWEVSDPDGNLDTVDLFLQDTTEGSQDDSAQVTVSGDTASGTTQLTASDDEGRGHSYDVTATVTDGDGNTASKTVSTSETEDAPTVDSLSLSEVEISDSDAEFDADWQVSDSDGDLATLDLTLYELDSDGIRVETEGSASPSVSGDSGSGTSLLVASGDDGSGNTYEVEAIVSDTDGTTNSATATETESEDTSGSPIVDSLSLSEDNSGGSPHADFDASWSVSDSDGDLDTVDLTLYELDNDGNRVETEESTSIDVSGSDASGTSDLKAKFDENNSKTYEVELVVTDTNGNSASDTATEVEDDS